MFENSPPSTRSFSFSTAVIVFILFKPKEIPLILSIAATIGVSSIALGPILGGILTEYFNWRWMFLYNIPVGIIIFILGYLYLDLKNKDKTLIAKIDYRGILLLAITLIALLIFLEEGERRDWFYSNSVSYTHLTLPTRYRV